MNPGSTTAEEGSGVPHVAPPPTSPSNKKQKQRHLVPSLVKKDPGESLLDKAFHSAIARLKTALDSRPGHLNKVFEKTLKKTKTKEQHIVRRFGHSQQCGVIFKKKKEAKSEFMGFPLPPFFFLVPRLCTRR